MSGTIDIVSFSLLVFSDISKARGLRRDWASLVSDCRFSKSLYE